MIRLTAPSTGPEFQWVVSPAVTALKSPSRPAANVLTPGRPTVIASVIHSVRRSPSSIVSISANEPTRSAVVSSFGHWSRTDFLRIFSSSVRVAGCRVSHPVTWRIDGAAGAGGAPFEAGRDLRTQSWTVE